MVDLGVSRESARPDAGEPRAGRRRVMTRRARMRRPSVPRRHPRNPTGEMSLVEHLRELRSRLIRSFLAVIPGAIFGWIYYQPIIKRLTEPACRAEIRGIGSCGLVTQTLTGPINLALSVSVVTGLVVASPVWLYQLWAFVTPGLYKNERRWSMAFVATSVPLFLGGGTLCWLLLPKIIKVLIGFAPADATPIIAVNDYLNIVLRLMLAFGLAFELPVFLVLLNAVGVLPATGLRRAWRGAVFGIFLFAAIATPTGDPYTMCALAVPMTLLYGVAYLFCIWNDRRRGRRRAEEWGAVSDDEVSPLDEHPSRLDDLA